MNEFEKITKRMPQIENEALASSCVNGASLLNEISQSLKNYVIFSQPEEADAITLWCAGTYLMDQWNIWPKLYIHSPERDCGKTTLLSVVEAIVKNGLIAANITPSSLYRIVELSQRTLCIDEADRFLGENPELNGLMNAGHTRRTATKLLTEAKKDGGFEVKEFSLWSAQVIAGIGSQADTLLSRSIKILLRRKTLDEKIHRMTYTHHDDRKHVRESLSQWANEKAEYISEIPEKRPEGASDRAQDNWTPLFIIADLVGEDWPEKAVAAFKKLEIDEKDDTDASVGVELLQDIKSIIDPMANDHIPARRLREALTGIPDGKWASFNYGKPISDRWLSKRLQEYKVKSTKLREHNVYWFVELKDAFNRYIS